MLAHFGLDIGSYSIKAVMAEKRENKYRLMTFGEIKTPVSLASQAEADKIALVSAIKKLLLEIRIGVKDVVLSLSEREVFSQVIEMPYLSEMELVSAINYEAEQYIPIPLNEVKLEYLVLSNLSERVKDKKIEVLLVAAKLTSIKQLTELTEASGLVPQSLETETLSLVRVINLNFNGNLLFLNLGHATATIGIIQNQNLKFIRTLKTAGEAFTRAISRELNMEIFQAEQYKSAYGLDGAVLEGKVAKVIMPPFNIILSEVKKALNFFLQKQTDQKINTLIISGGSVGLPGLSTQLAKALNVEVVCLDPFASFIPDPRLNNFKGQARFATAVGLAIRED